MAQEKETILRVTNSLKEYKQQIDAIKATMVGLSRDTDEYKKAATQAAQMQEKLNQVLYDSKNGGDAAANTMAALKEQLRELKKEANNTEIGSKRFEELTVQIKATNDKLKELEGGMGIFNRSVGDYSNQIIDAFGKMGISIGGLDKGFALATNGTKGFKSALDIIAKHPFIAVATILVGALIKIKDAISSNEELSKKWSVAMSAFQPILDGITKGINWLATQLVNVVTWVTNSIPTVIAKVGSFAKSITNIIGNIADVVLWLPKQIVNAWVTIQKTLTDGIAWVLNKAADAMDFIGMDETAANLRSFTKGVQNTIKGALDTINGYVQNSSKYIKEIGNSIDQTTKKVAQSMQSRMAYQKQVNKLEEDQREQLKKSAESELKQNELRNKAAAATGEERIKLLKQLREEIQKNGAAELDIAQRQLALQKQRNTFTPNSKADNDYTAQLEANVTRVQAAIEGAQTRIIKQTESTESAISAAATKAQKEALKAQQDTEKKRIKDSAEFVKTYKEQLESIVLGNKEELAKVTNEEDQLKNQGLLTPQQLLDYEKEKYTIIKQGYDKQIEQTQKALENEALTDSDKLTLLNQLTKLYIEADNKQVQHNINANKLKLEDAKRHYKELLQAQERYEVETQQKQDAEFVNLAQKYVEGKLSYSEYTKALIDLQKNQVLEQANIDVQNAQTRENLAKENWDNIVAIYGSGSTEAQAALQELANAHDKVIEAQNRQVEAAAEAKTKQTKANKDTAKSYLNSAAQVGNALQSLGNTIASTMQSNIKAKLAEGKISEEEAKNEFERTKKLQIAMATISMLSGVAQAISGAMELGPILGPIMGAINSAAVIASGVAQIQEIKRTQLGGGGDTTTPTAPSAPTVASIGVNPLLNENLDGNSLQTIQTQTNLEGNTTNTRVYVVESDITDAQRKTEVRENNATF